MKIGSGGNKKVPTPSTARAGGAAKAGRSGAARGSARARSGSDHVEISPHAREVQQALELATSAPEIRTEKVAPLKREVEAGTYHRPSDAIAERIVEEMKHGPG
ncbi:MAG: flagellar biosynthesis anti-sigma factor FlgM [Nitrospirae bacterium]|nr:MAG: flagellar biosynthesis anti-sigma factor FlgM [Nitrospirota bacterium]